MVIRKPVSKDLAQLKHLFEKTIQKAFEADGYGDALDEIKREIQIKMKKVEDYLQDGSQTSAYLIAEHKGCVIGAISFGKIGEVTLENVPSDFPSEGELGSMYILPEYQGEGIARQMIEVLLRELHNNGIRYVSFDSGYKPAQEKWRKKFGDPYKIVENYWAEGVDLYIWLIHLEEYMRDI